MSGRLRKAVVRIVHHAVNAGVTDDQARGRVSLVCRNAEEIEQAMELFRRWRDSATTSVK